MNESRGCFRLRRPSIWNSLARDWHDSPFEAGGPNILYTPRGETDERTILIEIQAVRVQTIRSKGFCYSHRGWWCSFIFESFAIDRLRFRLRVDHAGASEPTNRNLAHVWNNCLSLFFNPLLADAGPIRIFQLR